MPAPVWGDRKDVDMLRYPCYTHPKECECRYCDADGAWATSVYGPSRRSKGTTTVGEMRGFTRSYFPADNTVDTRPCAECRALPCTCDGPQEIQP